MNQYLIFDSSFECGNLCKVIAVSSTEYELYLNSDTNSPHRNQWFYFMVSNTKANTTVKFTLMNQTKYPHFFKEGMKPILFSEKDNKAIYISWTCKVDNLNLTKITPQSGKTYGIRQIQLNKGCEEIDETVIQPRSSYYSLTFTHTFKYDNDRVYFAFNKPYEFSRLNKYLCKIENCLMKENPKATISTDKVTIKWMLPDILLETRDIYFKREQLCLSLGGVPVDMLIITSNSLQSQNALSKTKYVVITARVHSSETPGSYKVQGIIKFLVSKNPIAEVLRQEFVFIIVPMLNPDGVIMGNNRCSLGGFDLNRCWGHPTISNQPTIYYVKKKIEMLTKSGKQIYVYCDLHGHSKLLNSFIYACHKVSEGSFCSWTKVRLLPRILAKKCHLLNYHQCSFKVEPDKLNTSRVIVWKEFKVPNSFTLESSIYAYTIGEEGLLFRERIHKNWGILDGSIKRLSVTS